MEERENGSEKGIGYMAADDALGEYEIVVSNNEIVYSYARHTFELLRKLYGIKEVDYKVSSGNGWIAIHTN